MEKDDRYTRITLRLPKDLHERLAMAADHTSKSTNAEIVARLEESFRVSVQRPPNPAIYVAEMARDQKLAFIESIDRSLQFSNSDSELTMLQALRDAASSELEVIDRQLNGDF